MDNLPNNKQTTRVTDAEHVREVATILSREYSLEILGELHARGWCTASEVARELGIHIATAMRKMSEMESTGLVTRRVRSETNLEEYAVTNPRIEVVLDLEEEARTAGDDAKVRAARTFVRERPNRKVIAEADEERGRIVRLVLVKGPRWRSAVETLALTEDEGRFLFHIPFASARAESVAAVCAKAGISDPLRVARVLGFVEEAEKMGVVEVVR